MWRIKKDVKDEWDISLKSPVRFNKDGGNVDVMTLDPGFVILDIDTGIRREGTFIYLLSILRLPTHDDPPYRGKISFPGENVSSWTAGKYLTEWEYYFERIG
jgi:hypothetical protein